MLQVRLFGPLEISLDGKPLPRLRSKKGRWVIALLALRVGQPVPREWLAQVLWPDQDVSQAKAYLRQTLTELRTVLGAASSTLESPDPQHILLSPQGVSIDLSEFDRAIDCDPSRAVELYRGRLLEDCEEDWAVEARRNREASLVDALATLAKCSVPMQAALHYAHIIEVDPFRESAQRGLLTALFESGDEAAAIRAFRRFKLLLHSELNAEPSEETTTLYNSLLRRSGCDSKARVDRSPAKGDLDRMAVAPTGGARSARRPWLWIASVGLSAILLPLAFRNAGPEMDLTDRLRNLPVDELARAAWGEAYGPNEQRVGEVVMSRWNEIGARAESLRGQPVALASFAAPLWRCAYTINKSRDVAEWLGIALDAKTSMPPRVEALAAANLSFQVHMDSPKNEGKDLQLANRAFAAAVRSGDSWLIAHCLRARGFAEVTSTQKAVFAQGRADYDEAYRRFKALRDEKGIALMETCYSTSGAGSLDNEASNQHTCAIWAAKSFYSWRKIGSAWGQTFAADQLRQRIGRWPDPTSDLELCATAQAIFELQASRDMAAGNWSDAEGYRAWQTIVLIYLGETQRAIKWAKVCYGAGRGVPGSGWSLVEDYERSPQSDRAASRLIEDLRRLAAEVDWRL